MIDKSNYFKHSYKNRFELEKCEYYSCYYCIGVYKVQDIHEWVDDNGEDTGICGHCGVDTCLPGKLTKEELNDIYGQAFG